MDVLADTLTEALRHEFLGNSVRDYLASALAILLGLALVRVFQALVMRRVRRWSQATSSTWDDFAAATLESHAVPALYLLVVWLGLRDLAMREGIRHGLRVAVSALVVILVIRVVMAVVNQAVRAYWQRHAAEKTAARERSLHGVITLAKVVVWVLGGILLLDNLGIRVSAFVAGLGITGIAVALAAQTILGDLFAYFVIFFDQPFEVGHTIKAGDIVGEVEAIGLKTTRLRGPEGEQIVFSNKFLTDNRIQNFKRMARRKVVFAFELDREAPVEALRAVPEKAKSLFAPFADATFERAHLVGLGESGPRFEVAYAMETPDFTRHLEVRQELYLGLLAHFRAAGMGLGAPLRAVSVRWEAGAGKAGPAAEPVPPVSHRPD